MGLSAKFTQLRTSTAWIAAFGLALACAAVTFWLETRQPRLNQRTYRVGFDNEPPQHFLGKDGKPTGLAVELVNEAARRRGIHLQWVLRPESSEAALKSKQVDLWPMMTIRPERKGVVYITEPFREAAVALFARVESSYASLDDLRNSRIGYDGSPLDMQVLRSRVPHAALTVIEPTKERLEAVCQQRIDAAYFDEYTALTRLLDGFSCGGEGLRVIQVPELNSLLGLGATFEARPAADALREEIGYMAADGTLAKIGSHWRSFSGRNLEIANELAHAQVRERWLIAGIAGAVLLLLVTLWQAIGTRKALATAREATKLKSQFLANMSHEIRTPMNAILGMTSLAIDTSNREEQKEYLDDVLQSGESLLALLNDILDLSKIEAGKLTIERVDFDPAGVARDVCMLLEGEAQRKGLALTCQAAAGLPGPLRGDPVRLRQTLVNLVGNAIKFTERGYVDLRVASEPASDQRVHLRFAVTDTGIGISKDAQKRIFDSFVQADGSVTRKHGGTGLGLSISKELISKMGGELRLESVPGSGSTFWFVLPFEKSPASRATNRAKPGESRVPV